jgi:hypothetical protein
MLSSHLRLGLRSGLFPSGFPTKSLYTPLLSPIRATCPSHVILLDLSTRTILGEEHRSLSSSLSSFLHSPVSSSLLPCSLKLFFLTTLCGTHFWSERDFIEFRWYYLAKNVELSSLQQIPTVVCHWHDRLCSVF